MKIYTKTGDTGDTGLVAGERRAKDDLRVAAYGDIDELQAVLGIALTDADRQLFKDLSSMVERIQYLGFTVSSYLAGAFQKEGESVLEDSDVQWLEACIDSLDASLPPLRNFILPGGCRLAAQLHHARTVCRRAERSVVALSHKEEVAPIVIKYMNRLSDLLFVMARVANQRQGVADHIWSGREKSN